jgi:hypothetical protein
MRQILNMQRRRLQRLEKQLVPAVGDWRTRELLARLEAARVRTGSPPISPERQAELRSMTVPEILNSSRRRANAG